MQGERFSLPPQSPEHEASTTSDFNPESVNDVIPYLDALPIDIIKGGALRYLDTVNKTLPPNLPEPDLATGTETLTDDDFQTYGRLATRIIANRGVRRDDVEDIAQETLISLFRRGEIPTDSSGKRNAEGFVGTIAWRRVTDFRRHGKRRPVHQPIHPDLAGLPFDIPADEPPVEDLALLATATDITDPILLDVLESLTEAQRTALLLEAEGLSREEIAARMGTTPDALKATIHRARVAAIDKLQRSQDKE